MREDAGLRRVRVVVSPAAAVPLRVRYALSGTALPGSDRDYSLREAGTLTVPPGRRQAWIVVALHDDEVQEGEETLVLTLKPGPGYRLGALRRHTLVIRDAEQGRRPAHGLEPHDEAWDGESMSWRELLAGRAFSESHRSAAGHRYSVWGRGTRSSFRGSQDGVSLSGDTTALMAGSEVLRAAPGLPGGGGRALLGAMLGHAWSKGELAGPDGTRKLEAELLSLAPYGVLDFDNGLQLWGTLGLGAGELRIGEAAPQSGYIGSDLAWRMAAGGLQRTLRHAAPGSMGLALRADARYSRLSAKLPGLAAVGKIGQARLGLKGEWAFLQAGAKNAGKDASAEPGSTWWRPWWSLDVRHDSGDAEHGFGSELGLGADWLFDGGLTATLAVTGLTAHEDGNASEWNVALNAGYDPRPETGMGFSGKAALQHGPGSANGQLFSSETMPEIGEEEGPDKLSWNAEGSWGLHRTRRGLVGSTYLSLSGEQQLDETQLGYRMTPERNLDDSKLQADAYLKAKTDGNKHDSLEGRVELRLDW